MSRKKEKWTIDRDTWEKMRIYYGYRPIFAVTDDKEEDPWKKLAERLGEKRVVTGITIPFV